MRQIKFRGKRVNNGQWIEGYYGESFREISSDIKTSYIVEMNRRPKGHDIHKETVGQFTGLTDKNGKEIYEGDVVLFTWFSYGEYELETEYQGSIDFLNGSFLFCCEHGNYPLSELEFDSESDIEVIGSIHDNPELLK